MRAMAAATDNRNLGPEINPTGAMRTYGSERRTQKLATLAIIDQCLFTGTNFATAVIVGRWGGQAQLGAYTLAISIVMLAVAFQRSVFFTPYVVVSGRLDEHGRSWLRKYMLTRSMAICSASMAVLLLASRFTDHALLAIMGLAIPFACLRDFVRRVSLTDCRVREAILIDGAVAVVQCVTLALMAQQSLFVSAFAAIATSIIAWAVVAVTTLVSTWRRYVFTKPPSTGTGFSLLWPIGRWVGFSQVISTSQSYIMPWILAVWHSMELAGVYAACWTLVQVVSPVVEGLGNVLGPALARSASHAQWREFRSRVRVATTVYITAMLLLLLAVMLVGHLAMTALYGSGYSQYYILLLLLTLSTAITTAHLPISKALTQLGYAATISKISIKALGVILISSVICLKFFGESGAAYGLLIGSVYSTLAKSLVYRRAIRTVSKRGEDGRVHATLNNIESSTT